MPASREVSIADLTSRRAARYGITLEIDSMVPYDQPQAWAASLDASGAGGLFYRVRHDPAGADGVALFGRAGERRSWPRGRERRIGRALVRRLARECGIEVLAVPRAAQLRIAP